PGLAHRPYTVATGMDLHVVERPGTGTPVVLLHGIWGSWRAWLPLLAIEVDPFGGRPLSMVDLRGHGNSAKPSYGFGLRDYAGDVAAYVETFDQPVILIGHSLGALAAVGALAAIGDRLAAMVLEEPPLPLPSGTENLDPAWASFAEAVVGLSMLKHQPVEAIVAHFMDQNPDLSRTDAEETAISLSQSADGVFSAIMMGDFGQHSLDLTGVSLDAPALVFQADLPDDQMLKDVGVAMLRGALPRLELVRLPGTRHSVHYWAPAAFGARLEAFLTALNSRP
ncbi:MAG: alpha/beta fold hydrolase, partial [Thermomicrobiales bacterium]